MPLHLLGKKSWNVYNPQNIARVRQDEAEAKARDEKAERDTRRDEAATRLEVLRGNAVTEPLSNRSNDDHGSYSHQPSRDFSRKRRKLAGEDDTDRDIRLAQTDVQTMPFRSKETSLFDKKGHIDLIPGSHHTRLQPKESQHEEQPQGMRFQDAAGYKSTGEPWYTHSHPKTPVAQTTTNVWGADDPQRQHREQLRTTSNDPLQAMKRGVKQLRENERQRKEWLEQREKDLYEVERMARRKKRQSSMRESDGDSIEGFSLDGGLVKDGGGEGGGSGDGDKERRRRRSHHHHHRHRRRSRSPEREHRRHRHRSRHGSEGR